MDAHDAVRTYYRALDDGAYDRLEELLAPTFVQRRPDRTFEGRDAFLAFIRDGRPIRETTHEIEGVYGDAPEVVARGRLFDVAGEVRVRFVDVHRFEGDQLVELLTYTR